MTGDGLKGEIGQNLTTDGWSRHGKRMNNEVLASNMDNEELER